jgi:hypothetical protein
LISAGEMAGIGIAATIAASCTDNGGDGGEHVSFGILPGSIGFARQDCTVEILIVIDRALTAPAAVFGAMRHGATRG